MADVTSPAKQDASNTHLENLREQYATATKTKVINNLSDLDSKDKFLEEMYTWCKEQNNIVVLKSGTILSSEPTSRTVQNCKSLLLSKGIFPGQVYAAS